MSQSLLLEPNSSAPSEVIRNALVSHLAFHPIEAGAHARQHGGILVTGESADILETLAESLAESGVRSRIVDSRLLEQIPRAKRAVRISFESDALIVGAVGGSDLSVPLEDISGAHVWGLACELETEPEDENDERDESFDRLVSGLKTHLLGSGSEELEWEEIALDEEPGNEAASGEVPRLSGPRVSASTVLERFEQAELVEVDLYLTIYARSPLRAFRFRRDELGFAGLGSLKSSNSFENFLRLLERIFEVLPPDSDTDSIQRFLTDPIPQEIVRESEDELARFDRWYLFWSNDDAESSDD